MLLLTAERIKRNMTITDLSFNVRLHPATIGKLEGKKMAPYKPHKEKLAAYFGIPADELFSEVDEIARG